MDANTKQVIEDAVKVIERTSGNPSTPLPLLEAIYSMAHSQGHAAGMKDAFAIVKEAA